MTNSTASLIIRWEPVLYNRGAVSTDVRGLGRILIKRREKGSRQFVILLNNKEAGLFSDRADALRDAEIMIREWTNLHGEVQATS